MQICGKYQDANVNEKAIRKILLIQSKDQSKDCTWTKSYLINLHCVYLYITYIIYKSIYFFYIYRCTFPMIGYLTKKYSLDRVSIVQRYFFNLLFHLRSANSLRKNEIKLMFFPKSHILFAEEGRPVGPIDWWCAMIEMTMHAMGPPWGQVAPGWFLRCPGWQREPRGTGMYTYHLSTIILLLARSNTWWILVKSQ